MNFKLNEPIARAPRINLRTGWMDQIAEMEIDFSKGILCHRSTPCLHVKPAFCYDIGTSISITVGWTPKTQV